MVAATDSQRGLISNEAQKVCINAALVGGIILTAGSTLITTKIAMIAMTGTAQTFSGSIGLGIGLSEVVTSRWIACKVKEVDGHAMNVGLVTGHLIIGSLLCLSYSPMASFGVGAMAGALTTAIRVIDRIIPEK